MKRPTFPTHKDLCNLSHDEAERALTALRTLVASELASVYTSAGSNDTCWQVWSEITRRRTPLAEWAAHLLASAHQGEQDEQGKHSHQERPR